MNLQDLSHKPKEGINLSINHKAHSDIERQMAEFEATHGKVETIPILIRDKKYLSEQAQKRHHGNLTSVAERRKRADEGSAKAAKTKGLGDAAVRSKTN